MSTNRSLISNVKELVKERYADTRLSNKFVYSILLKMAKLLIKRESDQLRILRYQNMYQHLKCVEVIEAPTIDPCCGIKSFCSIWRTKDKLPDLYEDSDGVMVHGVLSVDGNFEYEYRTAESIRRKMENPWLKKYSSDTVYSFYDDGYLYFTSRTKLVKVKGVFQRDISKYNACDGKVECKRFLDENFYIPGYLEQGLIAMTLEEIAKLYKAIPDDINIEKSPK